MSEFLEFFAVTETGALYRIRVKANGEDLRVVRLDHLVVKVVLHGPMVGILLGPNSVSRGLVMFESGVHGRKFWKTSWCHGGGSSAPIIGLFCGEKEARDCLRSDHQRVDDPHWHAQTDAVVTAIGPNHPTVVIAPYTRPAISPT